MILQEQQGALRLLTLNRPRQLNAINGPLVKDLLAALIDANADKSTRVIVLQGAGRAFCAGDDLYDTQDRDLAAGGIEQIASEIDLLQDITRKIVHSQKVVVGAIHGWAVGAGFEWAINCDFSIWAEGTRAFFPEIKWGLFPTGGVTALLPRIVGLNQAKEMFLLGEKFDARSLQKMGLAHKVVPADQLMDEAIRLAQRIAALPQRVVGDLKLALNKVSIQEFDSALAAESESIVNSFMDPSTRQRIQSFTGGVHGD